MGKFGDDLLALLAALATGGSAPRYSIYLKDQIEYKIDRAPVDENERRAWSTIHPDEESRIYHVILRYSYCFPIFSPFAVRTRFVAARGNDPGEEGDEILRDAAGKAIPLTRADIAWILGMDHNNCRARIRRMEAKQALRFDTAGRCFLDPKPQVQDSDRRKRSVQTSLKGSPNVPENISKRLDQESAGLPEDVRTDLFRRAAQVRIDFLGELRRLRYREKTGYDDLCTEARNLISSQRNNSDVPGSLSSPLSDIRFPPTATEYDPGLTANTSAALPAAPANASQDFQERLTRIFARAGKPAPTNKQAVAAAAGLPAEAYQPYLDHLEAKIGRVDHPGVLAADVAAYANAWPFERQRFFLQKEEAEATPVRQQQGERAEAVERERWIKEELLPDRFAAAEEVERVHRQYPELREYTPPLEHVRAIDVRHVRHALSEIRRATCPQEIKLEQTRRLKELERRNPGIVKEVEGRYPRCPSDYG